MNEECGSALFSYIPIQSAREFSGVSAPDGTRRVYVTRATPSQHAHEIVCARKHTHLLPDFAALMLDAEQIMVRAHFCLFDKRGL